RAHRPRSRGAGARPPNRAREGAPRPGRPENRVAASYQGSQLAVRTWLIDTGPFVAYLNRTDPLHEPVVERLDGFTGPLVTTAAVVTEVMYFLSDAPDGPTPFAELLLAWEVRVAESSQPLQVAAAAKLMAKYADTPMDFADATLVLLAENAGIADIATLDARGFSTYRTSRGKAFRLVLGVRS